MTDQQNSDTTTQNIAQAIQEVSERATLLVREEIELAKAEVTEKVTKLDQGRGRRDRRRHLRRLRAASTCCTASRG